MRVLLDTHAILWILWGSDRMGPAARELLLGKDCQLAASYFSIFEMTIKAGSGKLQYDNSLLDYLEKLDIAILPADFDYLGEYQVYDPSNKDPFNNMLITVARQHRYTLATADKAILNAKVPGLRCLDIRR